MEKLLEKLKVTSKFTEDSEQLEVETKEVEVINQIHKQTSRYAMREGEMFFVLDRIYYFILTSTLRIS